MVSHMLKLLRKLEYSAAQANHLQPNGYYTYR